MAFLKILIFNIIQLIYLLIPSKLLFNFLILIKYYNNSEKGILDKIYKNVYNLVLLLFSDINYLISFKLI